MPKWLHDQLAAEPRITIINRIGRDGRLIKQEQVENETSGIIPILAQLSALDRSVKEAYYCHPATLHISKTKKEGGFCGYRNIQMLVSYIQGARAQGLEEFPGRTPGILKLQDLIERAWDKGINEIGRIQTGGIRDSRKYIGTPEVSLHSSLPSNLLTCYRHKPYFSALKLTAPSKCLVTPPMANMRLMNNFFSELKDISPKLPSRPTVPMYTRHTYHPFIFSNRGILPQLSALSATKMAPVT